MIECFKGIEQKEKSICWSIAKGNEPLPGNGISCNFHANFSFNNPA